MTRSIILNPDQQSAIDQVTAFLKDPQVNAFILCGSAGTGKTTLVAKIIERIRLMGVQSLLVAPTGRASRILSTKLGHMLAGEAQPPDVMTLHSAIYYFKEISVDVTRERYGKSSLEMRFPIKKEGNSFELVIIDEASMVGDVRAMDSIMNFGSGFLLSDLVLYINKVMAQTGQRIKMMFVGDLAQLSPVGSNISPALMPDYLSERFGFRTYLYELTTVMRQADKSGILQVANTIRAHIFEPTYQAIQIEPNGTDISHASREEAVKMIAYNLKYGRSSVAVAFSNKTVLGYNIAVRRLLWGRCGWATVREGEQLIVTRNCHALGVSNGDIVTLGHVALKGIVHAVDLSNGKTVVLSFREVTFKEGIDNEDINSYLILENLLKSHRRDLTDDEQLALLEHFEQRHPELDRKSEEFKARLAEDPFYNALQVKFGYALTCHKAQGGEWDHVIVDTEGVNTSQPKATPDQ